MAGPVVIQDRSRLYRESLQVVLPSILAIEVLQVVANGESLVAACRTRGAGAVVFEAAGVPWDVGAMLEAVRAQLGDPVLIGTYPHEFRRHQVIEGVCYVQRTVPCNVLLEPLNAGMKGPQPGPDARAEHSNGVPDALTRREFQVLALICGGLTTAQMATRLGISAKTVENRRQTLFAKLGVQNQSHAIAVAMRSGLLGSGSAPYGPS